MDRVLDGQKVYNGGTTISVDAPLDEVPIFIKSRQHYSDAACDRFYLMDISADTMELAIYPDPNTHPRSFSLYEDDGKTLDYQNGAFATTKFSDAMGLITYHDGLYRCFRRKL